MRHLAGYIGIVILCISFMLLRTYAEDQENDTLDTSIFVVELLDRPWLHFSQGEAEYAISLHNLVAVSRTLNGRTTLVYTGGKVFTDLRPEEIFDIVRKYDQQRKSENP